jgi:hypothetical protein
MIDRFILLNLDLKEKTYEASKNNFGVYLFDFLFMDAVMVVQKSRLTFREPIKMLRRRL